MIIEILMLVAAATIFVVLARRFPATSQTISQPIPKPRSIASSKLVNQLVDRLKGFRQLLISKLPKPRLKIKLRQGAVTQPVKETRPIGDSGEPLKAADRYFDQKDFEQAEPLYLKAAVQMPKESKIYNRLGIIYLDRKNYKDAKEALVVATKLEPESAPRHYNLALAYAGLNDRKRAVVAIQRAIELDKNNSKYLNLMEKLAR